MPAAIPIVAAVAGAAIAADASRSAGNKQADAARESGRVQWDIYNQQREDQAPYREAGYSALGRLSDLLGLSDNKDADGYGSLLDKFTGADLENDPGYKFRLQQGQDALENSAAARGGLFSGAAGKALTEYGQGFASNEINNAYNRFKSDQNDVFNRLSGVAGTGQTATQQVGQAGQNYANQYGNSLIGGANAQAAAGLAQGNQWGGVINQLGAMGQRGDFGNFFGNSYTTPGPSGAYSNPYGDTGGGIDPNNFLGGYASAGDYSDPGLKVDVAKVGERPDGLGEYEFRYVWGGRRRVGLMADEVERLYPHAVSRDPVGFLKVDYSKVPQWPQ